MFGANGIDKKWFLFAFSAKLFSAICLWAIYSFYYGDISKADIFRYYNDSQIAYQQFGKSPINYFKIITSIDGNNAQLKPIYMQMNNWDKPDSSQISSNNKFIIRYLCFLSLLTFGSYFAILIITIFLSFTGLFWIFRFFYHKMPNKKWWIFAVIFFTPSVLFWTSSILKESIIIFFIGLVLNCGNFALKKRNPQIRILMVLLAFVAIFQIKAFVAIALLLATVAYIWNHFHPRQMAFISYFVVFLIIISIGAESSKFMKRSVYQMIIEKKVEFVNLAIADKSNSLIEMPNLDATTFSFAKNTPKAIFNVIARPWIWEAKNSLSIMASIENILLLILIFLAIFYYSHHKFNSNLFWFCLAISISLFALIGLSTPILGAISRYRVIPLLFFEIALIQLIDMNKLAFLKRNKANK